MGPPFNGAALRPGFSALRARKVLKIDRPSVGGFGGLTAAAPLRVVVSTDGDEYICCLRRQENLYNRASPAGNAPLLSPAATSPPEGEILAALCFEMLMNSEAESRANFPLRGKSPQGNRGAFPRAVGAVVRFSIPRSGIIKLIARRAIPQPSATKWLSNLRTLRTFAAQPRQSLGIQPNAVLTHCGPIKKAPQRELF